METNVNYTIVGAFVIILIAAIVLTIIWLSSGFSFQPYAKYMVLMSESVNGLLPDSPVEFNGVNVGSVDSIRVNTKNPKIVEVVLGVKSNTPITRGTVATVNSRGVTGVTFIALTDKSNDLRRLTKQRGQPYPIITSGPSIFVRLEDALGQLSSNFHDISATFQSVFDQENQKHIKATFQHLDEVTQMLAKNNQRFEKIIKNTEKASLQLGPLFQSGNRAVQTIESQTLPAAYHLLDKMDSVVQILSEVALEMKQNPAVLIRGVNRQTLGPGEHK